MHMVQRAAQWTLDEVHRLPDDGNRYELVRGELLVTPPPSAAHEHIASVLRSLLEPYVAAEKVGRIFGPRAVVQIEDSEVEPDLMIRPMAGRADGAWATQPLPVLVVEIVSESSWRRDHVMKRNFYLEIGIPEYWIADRERRSLTVVKPGRDDVIVEGALVWHPAGARTALHLDVRELFRQALG